MEAETDPEATARFVDLVTTHYTYFLRERRQFDFLRTTAFPELERSKPNRTWNILCAGCSTGEECYTASMIVEDPPRARPAPVRITGIDISKAAIEKARRATYQFAHVEKVPPRWLSSYFTNDGGNYTVTDAIRRRVTFAQANLNDPMPSSAATTLSCAATSSSTSTVARGSRCSTACIATLPFQATSSSATRRSSAAGPSSSIEEIPYTKSNRKRSSHEAILENASIGRILMMSYVSIIVLFVVSICVAVFGVHQNSAMTTEFYEQPYRVSKSALSLRSTVEQISNQLKQCLVTEDSLERERLVDTINQLAIEREAEYNVIAANFKSDAKVLDQFALASEALLSARDEVVDELRSATRNRPTRFTSRTTCLRRTSRWSWPMASSMLPSRMRTSTPKKPPT